MFFRNQSHLRNISCLSQIVSGSVIIQMTETETKGFLQNPGYLHIVIINHGKC